MSINSKAIQEKTFKTQFFGGYSQADVRRFLAELSLDIEELKHENNILRKQNKDLKDQLSARSKDPPDLLVNNLIAAKRLVGALQDALTADFAHFIREQNKTHVLEMLAEQTAEWSSIAFIAMGAQNAAMYMPLIPQERQLEICLHFSHMREIKQDSINQLVKTAQKRLGSFQDKEHTLNINGLDYTGDILQNMSRDESGPILTVLETENKDLKQEISSRILQFDDLSSVSSRDTQTLLKEVDKGELLVALKHSTDAIKEHFLSNVSKRQAQDLKEELEIMGPVQPSRVKMAQKSIVMTALELRQNGSIWIEKLG